MSKQQLLKDLIGAKALIDAPEKWTQEELARAANGARTGVIDCDATCFCSMGAFVNYLHGVENEELRDRDVFAALDASTARASGKEMSIVAYNDTHTHAEVMAVWDSAIAAAQVSVQIENLEVLLTGVAAQPEALFNLSKYKQETACGTLFCTVGLATTLPHFQALGFKLVTEPLNTFRDDGSKFTGVKVGEKWIFDSGVARQHFGAGFDALFSPAGVGDEDGELGYVEAEVAGGEYEVNMTDKELAVARLKHVIEQLKEQAWA